MYEVRNSLVGHSLPERYTSDELDQAAESAATTNADKTKGGQYMAQPVYWPH